MHEFLRKIKTGRLGRMSGAFMGYSTKKKVLVSATAITVALLVMSVLTYAYFVRDISNRERLMNRNNTGIQLMDRKGEVFYSFGKVNERNDYKLQNMPKSLQQATIASEDKDFYEHPGFSAKGILGALYANVVNTDSTGYGGSTITQQLVKNNLLTSGKNLLRKYQELSIAIAVDRQYTKDEILEMYLNSVYFGEGAFGIESASKAYFNKTPDKLTLAESSMLIGILPAPSTYSPISGDKDEAKLQQKRVLNQMVANGFITGKQSQEALSENLVYESAPDATNDSAEHFAQMVLEDLNERYGEERVARSGFKVNTGLDMKWQLSAEDQVEKRVAQLESQGGRNSSVVAIDSKTNEVRALVGSVDWENQKFGKVNMATSPRQPGSSFKPIYYAEAMDRRLITPATILKDSPRTFGSYRPQNYDFKFLGNITTRRALAQSRNLTAIEVMEKLGVDESAEAARRMGISTINEPDKYGLTLALGTAEATLIDMTNAYAAFANEGKQDKPVLVVSIEDKFNKTIFKHKAKQKQVQSKEASYLVSSILSDRQARAPTFSSLDISGRTVAVKTGTTDNSHDAWTIGYTPSVALGVWLGNNENEAMSGVAGASGAGPIWRNTMETILEGSNEETFKQPSNIEKVLVCSVNGHRATKPGNGTYSEFFIKGTVPTQTCNNPAPKNEEKKEGKKEEKKEEPKKKEEGEVENDDSTSEVPATQPVLVQCADGKDNDGDGRVDTADPGCSGSTDSSEADEPVSPPPEDGEPDPTP